MPEISRFLGIIIFMNYNDHAPPHFHAKYSDFKASFSISELRILDGILPARVMSLVIEWAFFHRIELQTDWELAMNRKPLNKIEPLV